MNNFVTNPNFTFAGQPVDSTAVLIRYTYDRRRQPRRCGQHRRLRRAWRPTSTAPASWFNGDFKVDGKVNAIDFNALAINFGQPPLSSPAWAHWSPSPRASA